MAWLLSRINPIKITVVITSSRHDNRIIEEKKQRKETQRKSMKERKETEKKNKKKNISLSSCKGHQILCNEMNLKEEVVGVK